MITDYETALRLVLSCVLGGIIGYERQARRKSAGLRTNILVALGSCLVMVLSINIYFNVQGLTNADPARLAAQVVSGIGFLGAGTIMKEGPTVKGLTTAASLWVVSGVGLACGSGYYTGAILTTGMVFLTLTILARWEGSHSPNMYHLIVTTLDRPGQIGKIGSSLGAAGISIHDIRIEDNDKQNITLSLTLRCPPMKCCDLMTMIMGIDGVVLVKQD